MVVSIGTGLAISADVEAELFKPERNVWAPTEISWKAVTEGQELERLGAILKQFDLSGAAGPFSFYEVNQSPYNARNFRVESADGSQAFCLREGIGWRSTKTDDIVLGIYSLYSDLPASKITIPQQLNTTGEVPYVDGPARGGTGNSRFTLFTWIDADHRFRGSGDEVRSFAQSLSALHTELRTLRTAPHLCLEAAALANKNVPFHKLIAPSSVEQIFRQVDALDDTHIELKRLAQKTKECVLALAAYVGKWFSVRELEADRQYIHGDPIPQDILVLKDGKIVIIDFEKLDFQSVYPEIGYALSSAVTQSVEQDSRRALRFLRDEFLVEYFRETTLPRNDHLTHLGALNRALQNFVASWSGYLKNPNDSKAKEIQLPKLPGYLLAVIETQKIFEGLSR